MGPFFLNRLIAFAAALLPALSLGAQGEADLADSFKSELDPILDRYCYDCHGFGTDKGGVTLDTFAEKLDRIDHALWLKVIKNTRAGVMPPLEEAQPTDEERQAIAAWIKRNAFAIDPLNPDPGRVTVRRLNRVEYRNTIRDLMGVDFDTLDAFPTDDSGEGFDNIADVLTISPMLLEKYLDAAQAIVAKALPAAVDPGASSSSIPDERHRRFFPEDAPADPAARQAYARRLLDAFARSAFRQPVETRAIDRLLQISESVSSQPGKTFEAGIAQAMVAVLASPRFLFREEGSLPPAPGETYPLLDDHALASRLSYFLWSSMPDAQLDRLADQGALRPNLEAQTLRMLDDPKADSLVRNFFGQWMHSRDIEGVNISGTDVHLRDNYTPESYEARQTYLELQSIPDAQRTPEQSAAYNNARAIVRASYTSRPAELKSRTLRLMREESERAFQRIFRENRSLLELIDSDYTYLNEGLANYYGIEGVSGKEMRLVTLPPDSPRGGILTQGTFLATTSNPTRTSPVKRGLFILENILGLPPAPPPPDIPSLEDIANADDLRHLSLRDTLALHREKPLCSSCHNRMDPLGLAFENFNALGRWRDSEMAQPIDPVGRLITGETFADVRELKRVLATERKNDFYHCVSEKLLTYALGRGLEYYDIATVDRLADTLHRSGGLPVPLILAIIQSAPFQRTNNPNAKTLAQTDG